ncbi:MAG: hypothetical protein ACRD96_00775 [Bryobacteraceae bacterium]
MTLAALLWIAADLTLVVLDEDGKPAAARVRARDAQGRWLNVTAEGGAVIHPRFPELGVAALSGARVHLPEGTAVVRVERGTEYIAEEFAPAAERTVRLRRWIHMARRGWWSGDLHVHRRPEEMALLMEAADLHFAPAITRWNENSNTGPWPATPLMRAGKDRAYTVDNAEDERDWGAALFFGLKTPPALPARKTENYYPPPTATWNEARRRGAFIDQEKIIWRAAPLIAALVPPDSIGVALNHFLEEGLLDNEAWGRPRDRARYPGQAGFLQYIFDLYGMYLSAGLRIPASAGSANGVLKNPIGYNRSYVNLGGSFSAEEWMAGQKAGRNFVTNGPMLFLRVRESDGRATVQLEALSSGELEKAEIVVNGAVVETFTPQGQRSRIVASAKVRAPDGGWLAARCYEKNPATVRFAHTSPVYFGKTPARSGEALARMREWIDALVEHLDKQPLTDSQREEWFGLARKARERFL